jgi:protein-S-isoprenylcysteine O-methyltransferase Ste14
MSKRIKLGRHLAISRLALDKFVLAGFCLFVFAASLSGARAGMLVHQALETIGLFLMATAIVGSVWCEIHAGSDEGALIQVGPYSVCRNPMAVFAVLGAFGAAAQFGTWTATLVCAAAMIAVVLFVTHHKEQALRRRFPAYEAYCARVPRFAPRFRLWRSARVVRANPARITRAFLLASLVLLANPIAEFTETLHRHEKALAAKLALEAHLPELPSAHARQ